jgi:hypothetical protein
MVKFKKIAIALVVVTLGMLLFFVCSAAIRGALIGLWDVPAKLNWKEKTTPLDPAVVKDLCATFSLPSEDPKCKPNSVVYAPDFFGVVRETFAPSDGVWATYDQVQEKIGKYQYHYELPITTGDGFTYFVVGYDLQGDRVYPIAMFFYEDGRLWRLVADVGD